MAKTPTKETKQRIKKVALSRVEGMPWATVARRYGYKDANAAQSTITGGHPDLWRAEYEKARTNHLDEVEAEAMLTQRELLRPFQTIKDKTGKEIEILRDEKIRQAAAHSLLNHTSRQRSMKVDVTHTTDQEQMQVYMDALQAMIRTMPGNRHARPEYHDSKGTEDKALPVEGTEGKDIPEVQDGSNGKGRSPGDNGGG